MKTKSIKDIVKNNVAEFVFFRDGCLYYDVKTQTGETVARFPVDVTSKDEIGNAAFMLQEKAITLMRYINKAIKNETIFIF